MILAFDRSQHILLVRQFPSDIIVSYVGGEVVIENICLERDIAVDEPHFFAGIGEKYGQLLRSVVVEFVGIDEKCVALSHLHIAECIE